MPERIFMEGSISVGMRNSNRFVVGRCWFDGCHLANWDTALDRNQGGVLNDLLGLNSKLIRNRRF